MGVIQKFKDWLFALRLRRGTVVSCSQATTLMETTEAFGNVEVTAVRRHMIPEADEILANMNIRWSWDDPLRVNNCVRFSRESDALAFYLAFGGEVL